MQAPVAWGPLQLEVSAFASKPILAGEGSPLLFSELTQNSHSMKGMDAKCAI